MKPKEIMGDGCLRMELTGIHVCSFQINTSQCFHVHQLDNMLDFTGKLATSGNLFFWTLTLNEETKVLILKTIIQCLTIILYTN